MNKVLLDTDIFSEIFRRKNPDVAKRAKEYHAVLWRYTVSMMSVMENRQRSGFDRLGFQLC
jgi:hypothetical protein